MSHGPDDPSALPLPPGSMGAPLVGETLALVKNPYAFLEERRRRHGPVFKSRVLGRRVVFVSGPDASAAFLDPDNVTRERAHPTHVRELFGGVNMNMFDGPRHLALKTMALEAFGPAAIATYLPDLQRLFEAALARWAQQGEVRAAEELRRVSIEAIALNVMGVQPGSDTDTLRRDYFEVLEGMMSLPIPLPGTKYSRARKARDRILAVFRRTIAEHREKPRSDGLSRILAARASDGSTYTDEEAVLELHHIVIAGYIVFALLAELLVRLAREPGVRARIADEIRTHLGSGPVTLEGLGGLRYAGRAVMEAKRTAPILPLAFGKARRSFRTGGFRVPTGWDVWWALSLSNSDGGVFVQPETYDPERFADGRAEHKRHRCAYVPQGAEPPTSHRCLGLEYSTHVSLVFLVVLLRSFDWDFPEQDLGTRWDRTPPEPKDGLRTRFRRSSTGASSTR